jgi:hypothetical protein
MTSLALLCSGAVVIGLVLGVLLEKWDKNRVAAAFADKVGAKIAPELTTAETELVALWRKHFPKAAAAAPAGTASAPASPAGASPTS